MPISDIYTARSGIVTVAATGATAALSLYGTAAKRLWCVGVRVEIVATTAAAGNNVTFTLARPNATNTGTGLTSAGAHDFSAPASIGQMSTAWSTAPTIGVILAEEQLPQTSGSIWMEYPPANYEWGVPAIANANANAGIHLFINQSVATSTTYLINLIESE
jgi:hypothetical protein